MPRSMSHPDSSDGQGEQATEDSIPPLKPSGACVHCKSLKVRCEFPPGEKSCHRCKTGGFECMPRTRKKRKPAPTHEDLQERSHSQDRQIQKLLMELDKVKSEHRISEWMTRGNVSYPQSADHDQRSAICAKQRLHWLKAGRTSEEVAISYFTTGTVYTPNPPDIVKYCSLFPEEILWLFEMYFERINPFFSLLDQELHTASNLIWDNPFLFTAVCATASKFYFSRPELYQMCTDFAMDAAAKALIDGAKSIETVQAYLIIGVYPAPKKRWVHDRSWEFMGLAMRLGLELELNQPPSPMLPQRYQLNHIRTWLNLVCVDGSHAIQFGKVPMLQSLIKDYLARTCDDWYTTSLNTPYDVHLTAYVKLLRLMAEWKDLQHSIQGRSDVDIVQKSLEMQENLQQELDLWVTRYNEEFIYRPLEICAYRGTTTQMITAYLRLVVLAVGFQHAAKTNLDRNTPILKLSLDVALSVIQITVERLFPTGHLRYAMDANFLYVSFAAGYLLNLLRPRFVHLLDDRIVDDIRYNVQGLINVLRSPKVALHGRHTPALYAQFLETLLQKRNIRPRRRALGQASDEVRVSSQYVSPNVFTWPDVAPSSSSMGTHSMYGGSDADMDLSLLNFVKAVAQEPQPHSYDTQQWAMNNASWDFRDKSFLWDTESWR